MCEEYLYDDHDGEDSDWIPEIMWYSEEIDTDDLQNMTIIEATLDEVVGMLNWEYNNTEQ